MLEHFHVGKAETRMLDQDGEYFCSLVGQKVGPRMYFVLLRPLLNRSSTAWS